MLSNVSRPSAVDVLRPFAVGDQFYADTTSTLAKRAIGSTNDVLIVSGGVPVWSSTVVLTTLTVVDSGFSIVGSADATKRLMFEVDAQTANDTLTINTGAQTDSRTLSVPVLTGNATLMVLSEAQTVTGNKSFTGTVSVVDGSFSITGSSDATKTMRFEVDAQTAADDLTINSGAQTDDRTLTVPVLTGNATLAALEETQTFTGAKTFSAITTVSNATATVSPSTGALVVSAGGLGVNGNGQFALDLFCAQGLNSYGAIATAQPSKISVDFSGGVGRVIGWGADNSTAGSISFLTVSANASVLQTNMTCTAIGNVGFTASTTARASINIPHGTAPSSPVDGDMWTTSAGLFVRISGVTVGPLS